MSKAVSPLTGHPSPVSPGRPRGARTRLSDKLLNELAEKFEQHGAAAMDVLIEVVEQRRPGGLDAAEWELMLRVLDLIKANVPADANASPSEVFGVIEEALRARYAKPIEGGA